MFIVAGQVVGVRDSKVGEKQTPIRFIQLLSGSAKYKELLTVKDFGIREYEVGDEIEIPVNIKAFTYKNGTAGLDLVRQKEN